MEKIINTNGNYHRENNEESCVFASNELQRTFDFLYDLNFQIFGVVVDWSENKKIVKIKHKPMVSSHWKDLNLNLKNKITNYSLAIDKFARYNDGKLDYIDFTGSDQLYHKFNIKNTALTHAQEKEKRLKNYINNNFKFKEVFVKQIWRMVIGLGATTAYNNGFLLHKLYGIPYLPGSAVKGVIRSHTINEYFDGDEEKAMTDENFIYLFGTIDEFHEKSIKGNVTFAKAFPENNDFIITADIMNNHNTEYYKPSGTVPSDTESPIPIKFLTLENAQFSPYFYIPKEKLKNISIGDKKDQDALEVLEALAFEAFKYQGIGAKTNVGYGGLKKNTEKYNEINKTIEKANEFKKMQELAKEKGIEPFLNSIQKFKYLKNEITKYYKLIDREDSKVLPENDHNIVIKKLDIIMTFKGEKRKQQKSDKLIKTKSDIIKSWLGNEKAEAWFNSQKQ